MPANPIPAGDPLPPADIIDAPFDLAAEWYHLTGSPFPLPEELRKALADGGTHDAEGPERWRITDPGAAEWAMMKLRDAEVARRQAIERRDAYIANVARWYERETADARRTAAHMEALLAEYALEQRERDGVKTLKVPSGEVATRSGSAPRVEIADQGAVIGWARANAPDVIEVTERVKVTDLRAVAKAVQDDDGSWLAVDTEHGEEVPGAAVEVPETSAAVKPYLI